MMEPALTTVRQDKPGLGAAACEALMRIIDEAASEPPVVILPTELGARIVRRGFARVPERLVPAGAILS